MTHTYFPIKQVIQNGEIFIFKVWGLDGKLDWEISVKGSLKTYTMKDYFIGDIGKGNKFISSDNSIKVDFGQQIGDFLVKSV